MFSVHIDWKPILETYEIDLDFLEKSKTEHQYPKFEHIFRVFQMSLNEIKVVILGTEPNYFSDISHGLSFSIDKTAPLTNSLTNIFKELKLEYPERKYVFTHGSLEKWTEKGIFLLNCSLTTEKGKMLSHLDYWKELTDDIIKYIAENNKDCVFLLMGTLAKSKIDLFNVKDRKRCVLANNPNSNVSGFLGSEVFRQVEMLLGEKIDWSN